MVAPSLLNLPCQVLILALSSMLRVVIFAVFHLFYIVQDGFDASAKVVCYLFFVCQIDLSTVITSDLVGNISADYQKEILDINVING